MTSDNGSGDSEKVLAAFDKSPTKQVRVSLSEFKGTTLLNLRIWGIWGDSGEYKPTRQGIAIPAELYPKLKQAVLKAGEALAESE